MKTCRSGVPPFAPKPGRGRGLAALSVLVLAGVMSSARADTSEVSANGFLVSLRHESRASPQQLYQALARVERWWSPAHTWSGRSENLSLTVEAGGCLRERWATGAVEHARVVFADRDRLLRLDGGLGPLQALAVRAILTFSIATEGERTVLRTTYRVSGSAPGLERLAAPVDGVIAEQVQRLIAFADPDAARR